MRSTKAPCLRGLAVFFVGGCNIIKPLNVAMAKYLPQNTLEFTHFLTVKVHLTPVNKV